MPREYAITCPVVIKMPKATTNRSPTIRYSPAAKAAPRTALKKASHDNE